MSISITVKDREPYLSLFKLFKKKRRGHQDNNNNNKYKQTHSNPENTLKVNLKREKNQALMK